jgi:hypothetical protein
MVVLIDAVVVPRIMPGIIPVVVPTPVVVPVIEAITGSIVRSVPSRAVPLVDVDVVEVVVGVVDDIVVVANTTWAIAAVPTISSPTTGPVPVPIRAVATDSGSIDRSRKRRRSISIPVRTIAADTRPVAVPVGAVATDSRKIVDPWSREIGAIAPTTDPRTVAAPLAWTIQITRQRGGPISTTWYRSLEPRSRFGEVSNRRAIADPRPIALARTISAVG